VAGALVGAGFAVGEDGALVEIVKIFDGNSHCCSAGMIKEEQAGGQFFEIDLIADDFNIRIVDKIVSGFPDLFAHCTGFEIIGFHNSLPQEIFYYSIIISII